MGGSPPALQGCKLGRGTRRLGLTPPVGWVSRPVSWRILSRQLCRPPRGTQIGWTTSRHLSAGRAIVAGVRRRASGTAAVILALSLVAPSLAAGGEPARNARIVGDVLVCNAPDHCLTRVFEVSAINAGGHVVAHTSTTGRHNHYRLRVSPGEYSLLATSDGLQCTGSAVAVAHHTVTSNITCLVP
jgi:hypothetical protein